MAARGLYFGAAAAQERHVCLHLKYGDREVRVTLVNGLSIAFKWPTQGHIEYSYRNGGRSQDGSEIQMRTHLLCSNQTHQHRI